MDGGKGGGCFGFLAMYDLTSYAYLKMIIQGM